MARIRHIATLLFCLTMLLVACTVQERQYSVAGATATISTPKLSKKKVLAVLDKEFTDYTHVLVYGQSLGSASFSGKVVTNHQRFDNLYRFRGGVRTYDVENLKLPKKHTYIIRKGEPYYGEMVDRLDVDDSLTRAIQEYKYGELIPLTEQVANYEDDAEKVFAHYTKNDGTEKEETFPMAHRNGETPVSGFLEALDWLLLTENGIDMSHSNRHFLASCPAYGSASFLSLWPLDLSGKPHCTPEEWDNGDGSNMNYFEVLMADVTAAKRLCDSMGKTYSVGAVLYYHESTSYGNYGAKFGARQILQLFTVINQRVKAVTGQKNDIIFIMHQSSLVGSQAQAELLAGIGNAPIQYDNTTRLEKLDGHTEQEFIETAMPHADIPEYDRSLVIEGQPIYGFEYAPDFCHLTAAASKSHGFSMAVAYKRTMIDKQGKWEPIHCIRQTYKADADHYELRLKFHTDYAPLIIDTTAVHGTACSQPATERGDQWGFIFQNTDGKLCGFCEDGTPLIENITVAGKDELLITTRRDVRGWQLHYAYDYTGRESAKEWGRPWGNLRDSRGDHIRLPLDNDNNVRVENWCPSFSLTIQ